MSQNLLCYFLAFLLPVPVVFSGQSFFMRIFRGKSPQLLTIISMLTGYPLYFFLVHFIPFSQTRDLGFYSYLFLLYSFSAYTYFHVFNMSVTSRRIRLLGAVLIKKMDQVHELAELYDDKTMIETRLERMVSLGQVRLEEGAYFPKGRLFPLTGDVFYKLSCLIGRPWEAVFRFYESRSKGTHVST